MFLIIHAGVLKVLKTLLIERLKLNKGPCVQVLTTETWRW